jgi:hypothetical protein
MGRDEAENLVVEGLAEPRDLLLKLAEKPGPLALLRGMTKEEDMQWAANLVAGYGKKNGHGRPEKGEVVCVGREEKRLTGVPLDDEKLQEFIRK